MHGRKKEVLTLDLNPSAEIYVPDWSDPTAALRRTTHLAIAAHQDDVEIMAQHGILTCYDQKDSHFTAVIVTDGSGSPRSGRFKNVSDEKMVWIRTAEQKKAADIGKYSAVVFLNYPSFTVRSPDDEQVVADLAAIIRQAKPSVIYTHQPADRHRTHVAVAIRTIAALRQLQPAERPKTLYGCEVWRSLDWVLDDDRVVLDVSGYQSLREQLLHVYESQIAGGKRYDRAAIGRQDANATFRTSHTVDVMESAAFALDMTSLMKGGDISAYIANLIRRFADDVREGIEDASR